MSAWEKTESLRIAALAAKDAHWRLIERNRARALNGDRSLVGLLDEKRRNAVDAETKYTSAVSDAVNSGERHPDEDT